jgi:hypothetical protein
LWQDTVEDNEKPKAAERQNKFSAMKPMTRKARPDIRALTRLVPSSGNLVQGQSELAINPALAGAASRIIAASQNHYGPAEGLIELFRVNDGASL